MQERQIYVFDIEICRLDKFDCGDQLVNYDMLPSAHISYTESYRNSQQRYQTIQLSYRTRKFHLE